MTELLRWIKPRLPSGYRAFIGTTPRLSIDKPLSKPDVGVRTWKSIEAERRVVDHPESSQFGLEPDFEVTVASIDTEPLLYVERGGWMVAAIEIVSPRNKDRPAGRETATNRYLGYLLDSVNLMVIDVLPKPIGFSFADRIAERLDVQQPPTPTPFAISYRVGEPVPDGGSFLAVWRRPMTVGQPLPTIPLPLTVHEAVAVDLETTYAAAAADAYLD
jgi:hypothetical protein